MTESFLAWSISFDGDVDAWPDDELEGAMATLCGGRDSEFGSTPILIEVLEDGQTKRVIRGQELQVLLDQQDLLVREGWKEAEKKATLKRWEVVIHSPQDEEGVTYTSVEARFETELEAHAARFRVADSNGLRLSRVEVRRINHAWVFLPGSTDLAEGEEPRETP